MTNDIQQTTQPTDFHPETMAFANRLKMAREALGLERKDAAAQLRLNEKVIAMLEKDPFFSDLPPTFIRGYLRSYGKLLQIPEAEIKLALEPIRPVTAPELPAQPSATTKESNLLTSNHYFIQIATYAVAATLLGLVITWWFTHSASSTTTTILATPPLTTQPGADIIVKPPLAPTATAPTVTASVATNPLTAPPAITAATPKPASSSAAPAKETTANDSDDRNETDTDTDGEYTD